MSNYLAIATVTATLAECLLPVLVAAVPGVEEITTKRPDDPKGEVKPSANIYLYQATPNSAWRNADLPTRRNDGVLVQQPQAALDLHYLLTFYGSEDKLEPQRLLGATVSYLHARSVLTREAIRSFVESAQLNTHKYHFLRTTDLAEQVELVKFTPLPLNLEELSKLWSIFAETPYSLSIAYQASVVLIDVEEEPPQTALPVRARNIYVAPFQQPVIEEVQPETGPRQPILASSTLVLRGKNLQGDVTQVAIGGVEATPDAVSQTRISLPLPPLPPDTLRAGVQGVQVMHERLLGTPPTLHSGVRSNVASFVLRPTITPVAATADEITIQIDPIIGQSQRVTMLLNRKGEPTPAAHTFVAPKRDTDTGQLSIPIAGVQSDDYLVRIQVDGAESLLAVDPDVNSPTYNDYIEPMVAIP